ncbi:hypothetical protein [Bacillus badius]|uniref:hypothetical protein n=1 Tax=Bacillus badius TaxID=1455 RepID=UPI00059741D2|nr:hypothetical protein [Bacillus badius]MED4718167.1 hypothetical protein [Bacillus badius]
MEHHAIEERKCAHTCLYRMEECLVEGNLDEAERTAFDFLKSIRELKKLQKAKENREQGVLVERVAKIG